jgi:hypothetical protein
MTDLLSRLESWYVSNCNGEWEHSFGIHVQTIDNPGWKLQVDLKRTPWEEGSASRAAERSDTDWIDVKIKDSRFIGFGGPRNLAELLHVFLEIMEERRH